MVLGNGNSVNLSHVQYLPKISFTVPPKKPLIVSEPANIETYQEGGNLQIMCIVKSGLVRHSENLTD